MEFVLTAALVKDSVSICISWGTERPRRKVDHPSLLIQRFGMYGATISPPLRLHAVHRNKCNCHLYG